MVPTSDEVTNAWFGEKAFVGYLRQNADVEQLYKGTFGTDISFTINLEEGTYTPFRIFWANGQGDYKFAVTVTAPGGQIVVNGDKSSEEYLVRFACGNSQGLTPPFPPFGQEAPPAS